MNKKKLVEMINKLVDEMKNLKESTDQPSLKKLIGVSEDQFTAMVEKSIERFSPEADKFIGYWRNTGKFSDGSFYGQFTVNFTFKNGETHDVTPSGNFHSRKGVPCLIQISVSRNTLTVNASADVAGGMTVWKGTVVDKKNLQMVIRQYANFLVKKYN